MLYVIIPQHRNIVDISVYSIVFRRCIFDDTDKLSIFVLLLLHHPVIFISVSAALHQVVLNLGLIYQMGILVVEAEHRADLAEQAAGYEKSRADSAEAKVQEFNGLGFWQRLFWKG